MVARCSSLLPESLRPGSVLVAKRGNHVTLVGTSRTNDFGEKLFRLKYHPRWENGWWMPGSTSRTTFSRDDLQELGLRLEEGAASADKADAVEVSEPDPVEVPRLDSKAVRLWERFGVDPDEARRMVQMGRLTWEDVNLPSLADVRAKVQERREFSLKVIEVEALKEEMVA